MSSRDPSATERAFIVAVDGPAGAGKSTVSRQVADRLGFALVDTGAIYRAVALAASRAGIAFDDDARLGEILDGLPISFGPRASGAPGVFLGEEDISDLIRTPEISLGASAVSARPVVRDGLLELQRRLAREAPRGAVLEGRDIGTVVFPDADAKFFLEGEPLVRAQRRHAELVARGQGDITLEQVLADQEKRDKDDRERPVAPLRAAADSILLDSTPLTRDAVVDEIVAEVERRLAAKASKR